MERNQFDRFQAPPGKLSSNGYPSNGGNGQDRSYVPPRRDLADQNGDDSAPFDPRQAKPSYGGYSQDNNGQSNNYGGQNTQFDQNQGYQRNNRGPNQGGFGGKPQGQRYENQEGGRSNYLNNNNQGQSPSYGGPSRGQGNEDGNGAPFQRQYQNDRVPKDGERNNFQGRNYQNDRQGGQSYNRNGGGEGMPGRNFQSRGGYQGNDRGDGRPNFSGPNQQGGPKKQNCNNYEKGYCKHGMQCNFNHRNHCRTWGDTGVCNYGDSCRYLHLDCDFHALGNCKYGDDKCKKFHRDPCANESSRGVCTEPECKGQHFNCLESGCSLDHPHFTNLGLKKANDARQGKRNDKCEACGGADQGEIQIEPCGHYQFCQNCLFKGESEHKCPKCGGPIEETAPRKYL